MNMARKSRSYERTKNRVRERLNAWMYEANGEAFNLKKQLCMERIEREVMRVQRTTHEYICPYEKISQDVLANGISNMIYPEYVKEHFCTTHKKNRKEK